MNVKNINIVLAYTLKPKFVILTSAFLLLTSYFANSQTPLRINYQAVARDAGGTPLAGQNIYVRFIIHENSAVGPVVWQEDHNSVTTTSLGLFNLGILGGSKTGGSLGASNQIEWGKNMYWLEVLVDPDAGGASGFINMGTTQFLSVPYAKHATSADSLVITPPGAKIWKQLADTVHLSINTNRVGIGTNSPQAKLQISDPGSMTPGVLLETSAGSFDIGYSIKTAGGRWLLGKETGEFDMFKIKKQNENFTSFSMTGGVSPKVGIGTDDPQKFFHVRPDKDFSFDSSFVVTSKGNVGIGTISPSVPMHINNTSNQVGLQVDGNDAAWSSIYVNAVNATAKPGYHYLQGSSYRGGHFLDANSDWNLDLWDGSATKNRVYVKSSNGNVGIGTTNPGDRLSITHTATATSPNALKISYTAGLAAGLTSGIYTDMTLNGTGPNNYGHYANVNVTSNADAVGMFSWITGSGTGEKLAVEGLANATAGNNTGVKGWAIGATTGTNFGLYGNATSGSTNYGLYVASGETKITDGNFGIPVRSDNGSIATSYVGNARIYFKTNSNNYYVNQSGAGDYSEYFRSTDQTIEIGELIAIDETNSNSVSKAKADSKSLIGVVSKYGTRNNDDQEGLRHDDKEYINVGLLGQLMVKVSVENGNIAPGDALTISEHVPGVAVKATRSGKIIGYALTHYPYVEGEEHYPTHTSASGEKDCLKVPHVMAFIQPTLWSNKNELEQELKAQKEEIEKIKLLLNLKADAVK